MSQVEYIKDLYENEGLSLREIARQTRKDFRTVQKYAYQNNWNPPEKQKTEPETFPVMGEYIPIVNEWLEQDEREPRKQRHTTKRIYDRLRKEKGYKGSYGSVKRYVSRKKEEMKKYKESFLPLNHPQNHPPGHAQVDFGKFKYYDGLGMEHKGFALIVSFIYSNSGWMQVFQSENQECLLTGLKRIFYHIGCVPAHMRCDNMSTAVAQIHEGTERQITEGFHRFMLHHRFKAEFCTPAKGNEKGNVENKVGYTRRSYEKNGGNYDWKDYLPSLVKKPGAVEHTRFFNQMPKLWQEYIKSVTGQEKKSALLLLSEIVADGNESLCDDALELAGENGKLTIDNIRQCYLMISKAEY
jgi:transposase